MNYKIIDIEGIGPKYAEILNELGIDTTAQLLERTLTKRDREKLAEQSGIPESKILTWMNHADLFRIKGVAGQFAELLEASGVDSVKELKHRVAANLHAKLVEVNEAKKLCNRVPSEKEIQNMIDQAKELDAEAKK